jgi:Fur family transcriptional regulator, iron response regulator
MPRNTLHQFADAGLLRQVTLDSAKSYFDTNTMDHHQYFLEEEETVIDMPSGASPCQTFRCRPSVWRSYALR